MNSYIRLRLSNVPHTLEDEVTALCINHGSSGLAEALAYVQPDLTYDPDILHRRSLDLDAFFADEPPPQLLTELKELVPGIAIQSLKEEHKDWLEEWKKGFVPFQLAGPYWVVPSWLPSPTTPELSITIDPGMAFGTGTHATTKMASYFVHKICKTLKNPAQESLIDVGTGTGILAMLARRHGVGRVVGIEIDPEARRVSRENVKLNGLLDIEIPELNSDEIREKFTIVVANIIDGVLVKIRPDLMKMLAPGGQLFLTGILLEREEKFIAQFLEAAQVKVVRRLEQDEWVGYWVTHA
jgi:ribosomal protein L11 methyltransferase